MSTDFSVKQKNDNVSVSTQSLTAGTRIGNALGTGNVGNSAVECEKPETNLKETRKKEIASIAKRYNVSEKDLQNYIQKALGYSEEALYALDEKTYNYIKDKTLPVVFNFLQNVNSSNKKVSLSHKLERSADKFAQMLKNGNTIEEATNFLENYKENGLFEIVKMHFPSELKQYDSLKDVPSNVLEGCIKKFFEHYKQNENISEKSIGKSLTIYKNLLGRTSPEDFKILHKAFIKVAEKEDDKFAGLISMVEQFKNDKAAFQKFIDNDLRTLCGNDIDYEKAKGVLNKVAEIAKDHDLDSIEFMKELLDVFDKEKAYKELKAKKDDELSDDDKTFIKNYETFKTIRHKKAKGKELTQEEVEFLNAFEQKKAALKEGIVAAITANNQNDADKIFEVAAKEYGISVDNILEKLIELGKEFDNVNLNDELLDKLTDGKFSKALNEYENKVQKENESSKTSKTEDGLGYTNTNEENYLAALENLQKKTSLYVVEEKKDTNFYVVTGSKPSVNNNKTTSMNRIQNWSVVTTEELRQHLSDNNISFSDILGNYDDLPASTRIFVDDMISAMSTGMQNYFLNGIKGKNHVVIAIVKKISANPEKLNLALDFASKKELERIQENKVSA